MGSVKDLQVLKKTTEKELGIGRFVFSNRYSVFDWGEMPDHIQNKGASLCLMGAYFFEKAEKQGIRTHYRGLVTKDGKVSRLDEIEEPTNVMEVSLVRVIKPKFENKKYDYSRYKPDLSNFLIPLEIIYRNGLPKGSSVFRRLKNGDLTLEELGLDHFPEPGERLSSPIFDVSTKLEESDRYVSWKEAQEISGLTDSEVDNIKKTLRSVNSLITEAVKKVSLVNEDGKIELAYDPNRKLMLVDVLGTLDECRFTYEGISVSKEIARQFYRKTNWYEDLMNAKKEASVQKIKEWKELCKIQPSKLPAELKKIFEDIYMSTANAVMDKELFECPKLENVVKKYKDFMKDFSK
ncbi:MAG: phosphoribosylaminoimidazolesuccinocarboxamide synthase [Candidatus Helarchaeota archaeon]